MAQRKRFYEQVLRERLATRRVVWVSGPRHVGKRAACRALSLQRLDWSQIADRLVILKGPPAVFQHLGLHRLRDREVTLVIENLHGHRNWQSFLRKLDSRYGANLRLVISMLDATAGTRKPASFCNVRVHPWSVAECARPGLPELLINAPGAVSDEDWNALLDHGGFPEPFAKRDLRFTQRWNVQRWEELIDSDLPRFASVRDPAIVQMLALRLASRSATRLVYSDLSRDLDVTVDTIRRWMDLLEMMQVGFRVRPWYARVPKALRKEPKWFLRDWSAVNDPLARARTFVACHLLKAVQGWTDLGWGRFELRYVRDKVEREADFLILREGKPWFLVDLSETTGGRSLHHFQRCTRAAHAFRIVMDAPYAATNCFEGTGLAAVPARTLLSQLL